MAWKKTTLRQVHVAVAPVADEFNDSDIGSGESAQAALLLRRGGGRRCSSGHVALLLVKLKLRWPSS